MLTSNNEQKDYTKLTLEELQQKQEELNEKINAAAVRNENKVFRNDTLPKKEILIVGAARPSDHQIPWVSIKAK